MEYYGELSRASVVLTELGKRHGTDVDKRKRMEG